MIRIPTSKNHPHKSRAVDTSKSNTIQSQRGMALISVLLIITVVMILGVTLSAVSISERNLVTSTSRVNAAIQAADGASEHARQTIISTFNTTDLNIANFVKGASEGSIPAISGVKEVTIDGITTHWEIRNTVSVPLAGDTYPWVDVHATATVGDATQTVVRRVGFADPGTFDLAMLSETVNCMFCHLQVNGDVGSLVRMDPGWGGHGSGNNSNIKGSVYAAKTVSDDVSWVTGQDINGATVSGTIEQNSRHRALPKDTTGDDVPDFPPIKDQVARANAKGTVASAALIHSVDLGQSLTASSSDLASGLATSLGSNMAGVNGVHDGNLILVGTPSNPIDLSDDIYVTGDLVIKGVVKGIGAMYAGRNIYIAGDVVSQNPAYVVGEPGYRINAAGNRVQDGQGCSDLSASVPGDADKCARRSIRDGRDTLRLAARGNTIVGDYTRYADENHTTEHSYDGLQTYDFYRSQFNLWSGWSRIKFDTVTGDELTCDDSNVCRNQEGKVSNNVSSGVTRYDAYDHIVRPGQVRGNNFTGWMNDVQYRSLLGEEQMEGYTWRYGLRNDQRDRFVARLLETGFSQESAEIAYDMRFEPQKIVDCMDSNSRQCQKYHDAQVGWNWVYNGTTGRWERNGNTLESKHLLDDSGGRIYFTVSDIRETADNPVDNYTVKARMLGMRTVETQVNTVDAYLYSNKRIMGKVNEQAFVVNGGLVARELGILAPGRMDIDPILNGGSWRNGVHNSECEDVNDAYYVKGADNCTMTVNYDYRLRNGGYGFNLVEGAVGSTLSWHLADNEADRVVPTAGGGN